MYMYIQIDVYNDIYIYMYMYVHIHMCIYIYIHTHMYIYIHIYIYGYVFTYVHIEASFNGPVRLGEFVGHRRRAGLGVHLSRFDLRVQIWRCGSSKGSLGLYGIILRIIGINYLL